MELACHPQFDRSIERILAWFECQIIDRPVIQVTAPKPASELLDYPSHKEHATLEDRWT